MSDWPTKPRKALEELLALSPFHQMKANLLKLSKKERDALIAETADPDEKAFIISVSQAIEQKT